MRCFTPTPSKTPLAPIPERSSIPGEPRVPAERTTSFVARTMRVSIEVSVGWNTGLGAKATPVARFSLRRELEANEKESRQPKEVTYSSNVTCFTRMPVTTWRFGRVSLRGYIMLCGTSDRMPVSASIHLLAKKSTRGKNQLSFPPTHGGCVKKEKPCTNFGHFCTCVRWPAIRSGGTTVIEHIQYTR
jgi:hypothetical protein